MHVQAGLATRRRHGRRRRESHERLPRLLALEEPSREFAVQHKLLLLETLYDAGRVSRLAAGRGRAGRGRARARRRRARRGTRIPRDVRGRRRERRAESRVGFPQPISRSGRRGRPVPDRGRPVGVRGARQRTSGCCGLPSGPRSASPSAPAGRTVGVLVLADRRSGAAGGRPSTRRTRRFLSSLAGLCGHGDREPPPPREADARARAPRGGEPPPARRDGPDRRRTRSSSATLPPRGACSTSSGRVAPSRTSVLIRGESGTGKELVARMIHARSDRARQAVRRHQLRGASRDASSSPSSSASSAASRPASRRASGRLETANGGTLFLDEIGDMPLPLQAKLLRVLQEREIERVGGRTGDRDGRPRSSRPRTPRCRRASPTGSSARTSTTACGSSKSSCRRCASGARTFRSSRATSSSASPRGRAGSRSSSSARPSRRSSRTTSPATSGSSRTSSKARRRSPGEA